MAKNIREFDIFMVTTVNLNSTRIERLKEKISVVESFINNSDYKVKRFASQGSWAHKTIIRPPTSRNDFDVDLLAFVDFKEHWSASNYIDNLHNIFHENKIYEKKIKRKTYCVQLNYSDEFHVDIVPCIIKGNGYQVCNSKENNFEPTNPEEYTSWFHRKNIYSNNHLAKVVRLLKYLRGIKNNFSVASIILSTLSAQNVEQSWDDLPTAFFEITQRIKNYLHAHQNVPCIANPVLPNENLTKLWENNKYQNFRKQFIFCSDQIKDAYFEKHHQESINKWQDIFGEKFKAFDDSSKDLQHYMPYVNFSDGTNKHDIFSDANKITKYVDLDDLPYTENIEKIAEYVNLQINIKINAYFRKNEKEEWIPYLSDVFLGINYKLKFKCCVVRTGLVIDASFEIIWRVTNTGNDALFSNNLRGNFEISKRGEHNFKFESTMYNGLHFIEAFIVKNNYLIARSDPFKVLIFNN